MRWGAEAGRGARRRAGCAAVLVAGFGLGLAAAPAPAQAPGEGSGAASAATGSPATGGPGTALAPWREFFEGGSGGGAAPWRVAGVPGQKVPLTRFELAPDLGEGVLRIRAEGSYGNLVHPFAPKRQPPGTLAWRWRVDQAVAGADLHFKAGDDVAVKVCALYDMPLDRVPFGERLLLRLARSKTGEALPAATVCYVWDATLPVGTRIVNAYSARLRYLVVASGKQALGMWHSERRDLAADFRKLFGDESPDVPPLAAIAVGADADNTKGQALSYVTALQIE
jgi:hypothetical protein